jgi:hypothetical protein
MEKSQCGTMVKGILTYRVMKVTVQHGRCFPKDPSSPVSCHNWGLLTGTQPHGRKSRGIGGIPLPTSRCSVLSPIMSIFSQASPIQAPCLAELRFPAHIRFHKQCSSSSTTTQGSAASLLWLQSQTGSGFPSVTAWRRRVRPRHP